MIALFNGTFNTHSTAIAPFIYAFAAATAATGARRILHKAVAAFRTMALFVNGTFNAHVAVFAPFVGIILAFTA